MVSFRDLEVGSFRNSQPILVSGGEEENYVVLCTPFLQTVAEFEPPSFYNQSTSPDPGPKIPRIYLQVAPIENNLEGTIESC
jgi:hypothetical protein